MSLRSDTSDHHGPTKCGGPFTTSVGNGVLNHLTEYLIFVPE